MKNNKKIDVIAIDGPAGSGKSTTARLVARKLGFTFLDTGAMYRAFTLKALQQNIDLENESAIMNLTDSTTIQLLDNGGQMRVSLDERDVTREIRSQTVSEKVSIVAAHAGIRQWMVELQRRLGQAGNIVAEGRDIGTVVFPNAKLKIFLVASLEERARRRLKDFGQGNTQEAIKKLAAEIRKRDEMDSNRSASPLKKAEDAISLDTTDLKIEQQVEFIVKKWKQIF